MSIKTLSEYNKFILDINDQDLLFILKETVAPTETDDYSLFKKDLAEFLSHYRTIIVTRIKNDEYAPIAANLIKIKSLDFAIQDSLIRLVKPDDLHLFEQFYPSAIEDKDSIGKNIIVRSGNSVIFDVNHERLNEKFTSIRTEILASKTVELVASAIRDHLADYMYASVFDSKIGLTELAIKFHQDIGDENMPEIFDFITEALISSDKVFYQSSTFISAETQQAKFNTSMEILAKRIECIILERVIPEKSSKTRPSIIKL